MIQLMERVNYGPEPRFTDADAYWALHLLADGQRQSRRALAETIGIGEGSIRKVIEILRRCELVDVYQTGIAITELGGRLLARIPIIPVDVSVPESVVGSCHSSVVAKQVGQLIRVGREQRDAGIRAGARGCTTIVLRDNRLMIPPDWNLDERSPASAKRIRELKIMENGDALIIGNADDRHGAINAAVSAAFELISR